ncbi:MAG: proline--tRNA ligase [Ardenticatenales bacterium]|nr:proline--tRNA ligase [Ardenticatenales bacterium]MCB9172572.1 proline--tRNA ligase [Ardenticatenales bacterium]
MRLSGLFGQTRRENRADLDAASHRLLERAAFVRQLGTGIYSTLHLGRRSVEKIEAILREEMNRIGGQELSMPVVHPVDLWQESGRWYQIGAEMGRFTDRNGREMVLAMTHEEVVADLVRGEIHSYKQLPRLIYHLQTKWRDDPRPRAGLIRVREFTMKDSYSLDADWEGLDAQYRAHYQAYFDIYHRCGLPVVAVAADVGMMGGQLAHEFMYLSPIGEDTLVICDGCGYTANRQVAQFRKMAAPTEPLAEMERVATPDASTIEALATFLDIPASKTAKALFVVATRSDGEREIDELIFAVIRGDMAVNDTKLVNALHAKQLRPARAEEIAAVGAVAGYASPVGLSEVRIVVDESIPASPNLVAGANQEGYHLRNVNYGRDYEAEIVTDIAAANEGDPCVACGAPLRTVRGVEVGNIFKLGTRYSEALGCTFLDPNGKAQPVIMGSYGIGVGRLLACVVEEYHDQRGIVWPISVAPYTVHLVALRGGDEAADALYGQLGDVGIETLYDDRNESPGVKFSDADLIGIPIRLTVSKRSLAAGGAELKLRRADESEVVPLDAVVARTTAFIAQLQREIDATVVEVPYHE